MAKIEIVFNEPKKKYKVGDLFRLKQDGRDVGIYMLAQVAAVTYTLIAIAPVVTENRGNRWSDPIQLEWGAPLDDAAISRLVGVDDSDTWEYPPCTVTEEN